MVPASWLTNPALSNRPLNSLCRFFHICFAQKFCRLFRRRGIDVEASPPLEPWGFGGLGHELDLPMIGIVEGALSGGRGIDKVVRGFIRNALGLCERGFKGLA